MKEEKKKLCIVRKKKSHMSFTGIPTGRTDDGMSLKSWGFVVGAAIVVATIIVVVVLLTKKKKKSSSKPASGAAPVPTPMPLPVVSTPVQKPRMTDADPEHAQLAHFNMAVSNATKPYAGAPAVTEAQLREQLEKLLEKGDNDGIIKLLGGSQYDDFSPVPSTGKTVRTSKDADRQNARMDQLLKDTLDPDERRMFELSNAVRVPNIGKSAQMVNKENAAATKAHTLLSMNPLFKDMAHKVTASTPITTVNIATARRKDLEALQDPNIAKRLIGRNQFEQFPYDPSKWHERGKNFPKVHTVPVPVTERMDMAKVQAKARNSSDLRNIAHAS